MTHAPKSRVAEANGLSLEAALRRWADAGSLQRLAALEARLQQAGPTSAGPLHDQRRALREALESELCEKVYREELTATGIPYPPGHRPARERLSPELWFLEPDDDHFVGGPDFEASSFHGADGRLLFERVLIAGPGGGHSLLQEKVQRLPLPLWFYVEEAKRRVLFSVGAELTGRSFDIVNALVSTFDEDKARQTHPDNYRYVERKQLEATLEKDDAAIRQIVARLRVAFHRQCRSKLGVTPGPDEIVQSVTWSGYRLNPNLIRVHFVDPRAFPNVTP
jgi:hypothetical protein